MKANFKFNNFSEFYKKQLWQHKGHKHEFIISEYSYKDIYNLAAGIKNFFSAINTEDGKKNLCICTDNKALIMAAILASIANGPTIILPHSYNERVLRDIQQTIGIFQVFTDAPEKIPDDIDVITPDKCDLTNNIITSSREPDSIFLKLFTGGSTGKPKIWSKTPRNILTEALYLSNKYHISKEDLFVSTVPPCHIYGLLFSILVPFISSSRTLQRVLAFPGEILTSIKDYSATILVSSPMHFRVLKGGNFKLSSLKFAFSSGGSLDDSDAKYFFNKTGLGVEEIYGSTETGGIASRNNTGQGGSWNPFENVDWDIIEDRLRVKSEFISPDLPKNNDGFFVTGDLVENIDNNSFSLLGRVDGIVKVAGKRVDLKDVRNKLKQIAEIEDAVVISLPSNGGRKNEIAALVEGAIDQAQAKQLASQLLEPYAVPRKIKIVDKIPVMSTGKYNRQAIEKLLKSKKK